MLRLFETSETAELDWWWGIRTSHVCLTYWACEADWSHLDVRVCVFYVRAFSSGYCAHTPVCVSPHLCDISHLAYVVEVVVSLFLSCSLSLLLSLRVTNNIWWHSIKGGSFCLSSFLCLYLHHVCAPHLFALLLFIFIVLLFPSQDFLQMLLDTFPDMLKYVQVHRENAQATMLWIMDDALLQTKKTNWTQNQSARSHGSYFV